MGKRTKDTSEEKAAALLAYSLMDKASRVHYRGKSLGYLMSITWDDFLSKCGVAGTAGYMERVRGHLATLLKDGKG